MKYYKADDGKVFIAEKTTRSLIVTRHLGVTRIEIGYSDTRRMKQISRLTFMRELSRMSKKFYDYVSNQ